MTHAHMLATGQIALAGHVFNNLDDLEAQLITIHNQVLAWRANGANHCPDPRCHLLPHPDHPKGHVITGSTWPDRKDRLEGELT